MTLYEDALRDDKLGSTLEPHGGETGSSPYNMNSIEQAK